ncbi:amidase family protein [Amycolatopsis sp. NPDC006131]|uniref:amidase family protein n=1 Tax=Amycolatopsis sp. NPDC006131 TaxID=3156731 RepID=UPI0033B91780
MSHLEPPTREQLAEYAHGRGWRVQGPELDQLHAEVVEFFELAGFERLDHSPEPPHALGRSQRDAGRAPTSHEDPFHAVIRFCRVPGADSGPLSTMRIGVKDNIAVAGVPMTEGKPSSTPFVPAEDAVAVERLLHAGASIVAKTNINLGDEGFGWTRNPRDPRFWAGGSSSGSAAAVAAGIVDAALGADQGGSIRNPASYCGVVGMKPTHGLVPTYGLMYWDHTLDHLGPITTSVKDNAAILEVIAGADWRDPQWVRAEPAPDDYLGAADLNMRGLRIGVVEESIVAAGCSPEVLKAFHSARRTLIRLGADVVPVSLPLWRLAPRIWWGVLTAGVSTMAGSHGQGHGHLGRVDLHLLASLAPQYLSGERCAPWLGRTLPLAFEHIRSRYDGIPFGQAQNLRLQLRRQVDDVLGQVDLLITPTTPTGPPLLDAVKRRERVQREDAPDGMWNAAVNLTGHPAISIPSGLVGDDLPTGLQIIGRRFDERTVYRAAFAAEFEFGDG